MPAIPSLVRSAVPPTRSFEPPSAIRRPNKKFEYAQKAPPPIEAVKEADEEIATVEVEGEVDETIILDDEEDGDVSGIIDDPAKEET